MNYKKVFDFIVKYKTYIFLPLICLMQFLACFCYDLWIVSTVLAGILILFSSFNEILCYLLFFQVFSSLGYFSKIVSFMSIGLICLRYISGMIRRLDKFYPKQFFLTLFICIAFSIHNYSVDAIGIYQGSALIIILFALYLIFVYREELNIQKYFDFLISGILVTALMSLLTIFIENPSVKVFNALSEITRLKLFTENENSLSIYCSLCFSYYIYSIIARKGNLTKNIIFACLSLAFGIFTLSKSFLVISFLTFLYLLFMLVKHIKLRSWKTWTIIGSIIVLIAICSWPKVSQILERFTFFTDTGALIDAITTNRYHLWVIYFAEITSSIPKMLFGVGLFNKRLINIGPHNLYVHILYRMGLVGFTFMCLLLYLYIKDLRIRTKVTLKNFLPIFVLILLGFIESFL